MNKALIGFAIGVTAGSLVTLAIVDKKYRKIAEDEIESMREYYRNKNRKDSGLTVDQSKLFEEVTDEDIKTDMKFPKLPEEQYKKIVEDMGYTNEEMEELLNDPDVSVEKNENGDYEIFVGDEQKETVAPYLITPEEFGDSDYEVQCLTYYADSILADEDDEIIGDAESIIGDALEHFGEYADDSVYVRNEDTQCDYEIIKHKRSFSEIYGRD